MKYGAFPAAQLINGPYAMARGKEDALGCARGYPSPRAVLGLWRLFLRGDGEGVGDA